MRQSYQYWGCPDHLWDNLTKTEVVLSNRETYWPEWRLLWTAVRHSFQNWGCTEHETDFTNFTRRLLWAPVSLIFQNWGCSEQLWDNLTRYEIALSRCETILPELRLLWAAVRPSSLSPVSFMLFWRLADRVRARASSTVLNRICLSWHCLKYVSQPKVKITFPGIEKISWCYNYTYNRTMTIIEEPWG